MAQPDAAAAKQNDPGMSPPADVHDAIVSAACELFGESGYSGVSTRDIAQKIGVRQATLYHYFASKQSIYDEVVIRAHAYVADRIVEAIASAGDPEEKIRQFFRAIIVTFSLRTKEALVVDRDLMKQGNGGTILQPEKIRAPHLALTAVVRELAPSAPAERIAFFFFGLAYGTRKLRGNQQYLTQLDDIQEDEQLCGALADWALDTLRAYGAKLGREERSQIEALRDENAKLRRLVVKLSLQLQEHAS